MSLAMLVLAPLSEVCTSEKVNTPRGLNVWSCRRSSRTRRRSAPNFIVWFRTTLVQLLTKSILDSDLIHGTEADYPISVPEKPPLIVRPTCPEVNGCPLILTPGMPRVVASLLP